MNYTILVTSPVIGQEQQNADFIIQSFQKYQPIKGIIVSNSALMGLNIKSYSRLMDFMSRQEAIVKNIQQQLEEDQWVISALFSTHDGEYLPCLIEKNTISLGNSFIINTQEGAKHILAISQVDNNLPIAPNNIDIIVLLKEYPLETYFATIPNKVSLQYRSFLTAQHLQKDLKLLSDHYSVPAISVPVIGQYNGDIWDGLSGKVEDGIFQLYLYQLGDNQVLAHPIHAETFDMIEYLHNLLVNNIKSYVHTARRNQVVIGLSGGIDSSVIAALCTEALGSENVYGLLMPGPYSSTHSIEDAIELCNNLGIKYSQQSIMSLYNEFGISTAGKITQELSLENLQSRLRGIMLMAFSNEHNMFVVNTCNKSEGLVGYSTLYGDTIGAFAPIGDLYKIEVYELAEYINTKGSQKVIPAHIITKPPSAELKLNQTDQDSLPEYHQLDLFFVKYLDFQENPLKIAKELQITEEEAKGLLKKFFTSEYKRQQEPKPFKINRRDTHISGTLNQSQSWE